MPPIENFDSIITDFALFRDDVNARKLLAPCPCAVSNWYCFHNDSAPLMDYGPGADNRFKPLTVDMLSLPAQQYISGIIAYATMTRWFKSVVLELSHDIKSAATYQKISKILAYYSELNHDNLFDELCDIAANLHHDGSEANVIRQRSRIVNVVTMDRFDFMALYYIGLAAKIDCLDPVDPDDLRELNSVFSDFAPLRRRMHSFGRTNGNANTVILEELPTMIYMPNEHVWQEMVINSRVEPYRSDRIAFRRLLATDFKNSFRNGPRHESIWTMMRLNDVDLNMEYYTINIDDE
jgi:hypothetical protein